MIKKTALFLLVLLVGFIGYFGIKYFSAPSKNLNSVYLIPKNAIYFVGSDTPIKNWKEVSRSPIWKHLQTNAYFKELTSSANTLDSILQENEKLFDLLGSKKLIVSTHPVSSYKYDYLFIVDLQNTAKLLQFQSLLKSFLPKDYTFSQRDYKNVELMELFDKKSRETLTLAVINNNLIASYTHTLVEAAISQLNEPTLGRDLKFIEINQKVKENKLFQLYVQYDYVDDFVAILSNYKDSWLSNLSNTLVFSGFDLDLVGGKKIVAKGYTNTNDTSISYMQALQNSGTGSHSIATIAPHRTSMYFSLSFDSFGKFYENYKNIQQKNPATFNDFKNNQKKIEDYLDINIQKHFISWMDDEVALLKLEPINQAGKGEYALVFKTKGKEIAHKNLKYVLAKIKKKTPVKFKEISYKGYPINFMSIKGFFKMFLGNYFKDIETPYFTIIDDFVIFSNHPNTLKYIITNYTEKHTLTKATNYREFAKNFDDKSNMFVYINTPMLYPSIVANMKGNIKKDLVKNQQYFTSFSQLGIQLHPEDNLFKSLVVIQYRDQDNIQFSEEFKTLIGPILEDTNQEAHKPIIVSETGIDEMETLSINPDDLNKDEYVRTYENGAIWVTVPLKDGKKHGIYKEYYKNGELRLKGRFKNDKKTGTWKKYDIYGKLLLKKKY